MVRSKRPPTMILQQDLTKEEEEEEEQWRLGVRSGLLPSMLIPRVSPVEELRP